MRVCNHHCVGENYVFNSHGQSVKSTRNLHRRVESPLCFIHRTKEEQTHTDNKKSETFCKMASNYFLSPADRKQTFVFTTVKSDTTGHYCFLWDLSE